MTLPFVRVTAICSLLVLFAGRLQGQSADPAQPAPQLEFAGGYAGFVDDATIDHGVISGALRAYLTPRVSIGPEVTYMKGPGHHYDLFLTGNVTFDLLSPQRRARRVVPFLVAGGGIFRYSDVIGSKTFASWEGAFTGGGGVRVRVSDRVFAGGDVRVGWEPHCRLTGVIGVELH